MNHFGNGSSKRGWRVRERKGREAVWVSMWKPEAGVGAFPIALHHILRQGLSLYLVILVDEAG